MKILFLADSSSPHILKWVKSIYKLGYSIGIFKLHTQDSILYNDTPGIIFFSLNLNEKLQKKDDSALSKLVYLKAVKKVKQIINEFKPDLLHAHYASSYGLIGALSGFHPFIISLWGGDILGFPKRSLIHKEIIKFNFSKADKILSTSMVMKEEAKKYTSKPIIITPFGIDTERFYPQKPNRPFKPEDIVIGTIKTLEKRYGIEYLIKAFKIVKERFRENSLKLLIVGEGTQRTSLEQLVNKLGLKNETIFTGFINHNDVENYHNMLDIYVAMSLTESFGVAVLEASACEKPVVVSNVGGLPEVVENNKTGFIVESKNYHELANALSILISNTELRSEMGKNGRNKVLNEFKWNDSVELMDKIYKQTLNEIKK